MRTALIPARRLLSCTVVAAALCVGCATAPAPSPPEPNPQRIPVEFIPITVPDDAEQTLPRRFHVFYAVLAHSNGKVYIGTNYHVARLVEFDPARRTFRVVATMTSRALHGGGPDLEDPTLRGDLGAGQFPMTRWTHAQDKIHAQLHEGRDGRVYGATHVKVEKLNRTRAYPGGHWLAYDPATGKTEDLGWARRHEGIITTCYDRRQHVLYGISWPTGYLLRCRPDRQPYWRRLHVLDTTSSAADSVPRYVGVAANGRVYLCDGANGDVLVYDPEHDRLHRVPGLTSPYPDRTPDEEDPFAGTLRATGRWRNWWMSGTRSPDRMHIYVTAQRAGHLVEIDATRGRWGGVVDHGRTVPWSKRGWSGPYAGLMTFGADGLLYHTVGSQLLTFEPDSRRVMDWGRVVWNDGEKETELKPTGGEGSLGPDGRIYAVASVRGRAGVVIIDPARLKTLKPVRLRITRPRVIRPLFERSGGER
jgi:hypothetical protein